MKYLRIITLTLLTTLTDQMIKAQDRQFARTYQSTVLPKAAFDIEYWNTFRTGRDYLYNRFDQRLEFEYGVTDRFQSAFYFNASHRAAGSKDTAFSGLTKSSSFSFSHEMKWKLSDPSADKMGFGLYTEYTIFAHEIELEGKIILDKKTEKNIFAYNAVGEYVTEWTVEKGKNVVEHETEWENDLAYMRMFKPTFGLGIEIRNHNEFVKGEWEHSALFGGPSLFWSTEKHFFILNVLPQWTNLVGDNTPLELGSHEKIEIRLLVGFGH